jgi:transcriptional regulator with XRE-family HTH domain
MGQLPRTLNPSASALAGFGAQLRSWREDSGLSQAELGRLVHVSGALMPVSGSRRVRQRLSGLVPVLCSAGRAGHATADRIRSALVA